MLLVLYKANFVIIHGQNLSYVKFLSSSFSRLKNQTIIYELRTPGAPDATGIPMNSEA